MELGNSYKNIAAKLKKSAKNLSAILCIALAVLEVIVCCPIIEQSGSSYTIVGAVLIVAINVVFYLLLLKLISFLTSSLEAQGDLLILQAYTSARSAQVVETPAKPEVKKTITEIKEEVKLYKSTAGEPVKESDKFSPAVLKVETVEVRTEDEKKQARDQFRKDMMKKK